MQNIRKKAKIDELKKLVTNTTVKKKLQLSNTLMILLSDYIDIYKKQFNELIKTSSIITFTNFSYFKENLFYLLLNKSIELKDIYCLYLNIFNQYKKIDKLIFNNIHSFNIKNIENIIINELIFINLTIELTTLTIILQYFKATTLRLCNIKIIVNSTIHCFKHVAKELFINNIILLDNMHLNPYDTHSEIMYSLIDILISKTPNYNIHIDDINKKMTLNGRCIKYLYIEKKLTNYEIQKIHEIEEAYFKYQDTTFYLKLFVNIITISFDSIIITKKIINELPTLLCNIYFIKCSFEDDLSIYALVNKCLQFESIIFINCNLNSSVKSLLNLIKSNCILKIVENNFN